MIDDKDKKYLTTLLSIMKHTKNDLSNKKSGWVKELSNNIPFVLLLTLGSFAGTGYALLNLTTFGNFILPIAAGAGIVSGIAVPKIIHHILENSNGKIGRNYTKHNLHKYFKEMIKFLESKDCNYILLNPKNISNLTDEQVKSIIAQMHAYTSSFYLMTKKSILSKIEKRNKKDLKQIQNLLNKLKTNSNLENKISKQIQNIVDKNAKFVEPWCKMYNQYTTNARKLFSFFNEWDNEYEIPQDVNYYQNANHLSDRVVQLLGKSNPQKVVEIPKVFTEDDLKLETINKTKKEKISVSTFEELKAYLLKKHKKVEIKNIIDEEVTI